MAIPDVVVLLPFTSTCPYRLRARAWVRARFAEHFPEWPIVEGRTDVPGFSRTQAILDGVRQRPAHTYVVSDADVWCDGLAAAVDHVEESGWAIPHLLIHRLAESSTLRVLGGAEWRGQQLSTDNAQDSRPYRGHETDTLCVFTAKTIDAVPPDPRFVGWGQEGDAWALALRTLLGSPWRGKADLVHLWHPAEPRRNRVTGNDENRALLRRYQQANHRREQMADLIEEAR